MRATPRPSPGRRAAEQALRSSEQACQEVEAVGVEVTAVSQLMRDARARNHFAEMIKASFEGGH